MSTENIGAGQRKKSCMGCWFIGKQHWFGRQRKCISSGKIEVCIGGKLRWTKTGNSETYRVKQWLWKWIHGWSDWWMLTTISEIWILTANIKFKQKVVAYGDR